METTTFIELLAIALSISALAVTVIGFFASLKFYRDGMAAQSTANDALAAISEKASSIQMQVGGMFDKTLDAAISGRRQTVAGEFEAIGDLVERLGSKMEDVLSEKGRAGEEERASLQREVDLGLNELRDRVGHARRNAEVSHFVEADVIILADQLLGSIRDSRLTTIDDVWKKHGKPPDFGAALTYLLQQEYVAQDADGSLSPTFNPLTLVDPS